MKSSCARKEQVADPGQTSANRGLDPAGLTTPRASDSTGRLVTQFPGLNPELPTKRTRGGAPLRSL